MIKKILILSKKLKNFSNKIERNFLNNEELNDSLIEKINSLFEILKEENQPLVSKNELNVKLEEKNYKLEYFLEKKGVLYYLNLISSSPIKLRIFLSTLEQELKKIYIINEENNIYKYNEKNIKIESKEDFDFAGKYLDSSLFINFKLIEKFNMNKKEIILHELIHLILFETGLQLELEKIFENKKIDELFCDVISKNWNELEEFFEKGGPIHGS